ncbi:MAG: hypothetical protein ACI9FG_000440 [Crocinitomicaceae bacterium]|jgi:hypothetical protein
MHIALGAFLINLRFSSVMVLAPLPRLALMDKKITPVLVSFDLLSGIKSVRHVLGLTKKIPNEHNIR